jgi:hypothetical protein
MEARQGWLQTRSIWRHCTEVAQVRRLAPFGVEPALCAIPVSDRGGLHRLHRLRGVELPVAFFNAASPLVPGKGHADVVWASRLVPTLFASPSPDVNIIPSFRVPRIQAAPERKLNWPH